MRLSSAVPELRCPDAQLRRVLRCNSKVSVLVHDGIADVRVLRAEGVRLQAEQAVAVFVEGGAHDQAVGAVIRIVEAALSCHDQIDRAVEAAEDREVAEMR